MDFHSHGICILSSCMDDRRVTWQSCCRCVPCQGVPQCHHWRCIDYLDTLLYALQLEVLTAFYRHVALLLLLPPVPQCTELLRSSRLDILNGLLKYNVGPRDHADATVYQSESRLESGPELC